MILSVPRRHSIWNEVYVIDYEEGRLAELYILLRDELDADFVGMDPNDPRRAPIAMAILKLAAQYLPILEIERSVRAAIGLPLPVQAPACPSVARQPSCHRVRPAEGTLSRPFT